jgi:hypothetical protein
MELFKPDMSAVSDMRVVILTPHADHESFNSWSKSVVNLVAYSWMVGIPVEMMAHTERMVVDWARNDLARIARDSESPYTGKRYTHALWLDDDMLFGPDMLAYLASEIADYDMISALYFGRHKPIPVVYVRDDIEEGDRYRHYPLMKVPRKTFECDAAGFGAMLMRIDILDDLPEPWFTIDARGGEDIVFCRHAKEHGFTVACAGRYRCGHITAPQIVTEEHHTAWLETNPDELQEFKPIEL